MKYVLFVLDGAADKPLKQLEGLTPLQYAKAQPIEELSAHALLGRAKTIPDGVAPGTDPAFLTIFGAQAKGASRATIEAAGMGIFLPAGEHALRANIICVDKGNIVSHCGGGLTDQEGKSIVQAILENDELVEDMAKLGIKLRIGEGFRHIWSTTGDVPVTIPPHDHLGEPYIYFMVPEWKAILHKISAFMEVLPFNLKRKARGEVSANMLWPWAGGKDIDLPDFTSAYGIRGCCATGVPLVKGVARLAGLTAPDIPGATGEPDTDWRAKTAAGLDMLRSHDFLLLHLEAPDEQAHRGNIMGKVEAIQNAGSMLQMLRQGIMDDMRIMLLSDHYTLSDNGQHDATPVPYCLFDSRKEFEGGSFTEEGVKDKPIVEGSALLRLLLVE